MTLSPKESEENTGTANTGLPDFAAVAVDRAVADLRRGLPVLLLPGAKEEGADALLIQASETVTSQSLHRLLSLAGGVSSSANSQASSPTSSPVKASLVVTARRGEILILSSAASSSKAESLERSGAKNSGQQADSILVLPLPTGFDADLLAGLADPTSKEAAGPFAHLPATPAKPDGVHDAAIAMTRISRLLPACVTVPLDASHFDAPHLDSGQSNAITPAQQWALGTGLLAVCADDVLARRYSSEVTLVPVVTARVPLALAEKTQIHVYRPEDGGSEHFAIVIGEPAPDQPVLARIHSSCFTGDLLESLRCDCGEQLRGALATIAESGAGILLYLAQEGRGIGLVNKLRAYHLQDRGFDTFEANEQLGFEADERGFSAAAQMLNDLGFSRVRLLTNNLRKVAALKRCDIVVEERVPHSFPANDHNETYLKTKARRGDYVL
jgi:GTP cyclohydrolase II